MDDLKQFLLQNREKLDVEEPEVSSWHKIEYKLKRKKIIKVLVLKCSVAASVLLFSGLLLNHIITSSKNQEAFDTLSQSNVVSPDPGKNVVKSDSFHSNNTSITHTDTGVADNNLSVQNSKQATVQNKNKKKPKSSGLEEMDYSFTSFINNRLNKIRKTPFYAADENYFSAFKKQFGDLERAELNVKERLAYQDSEIVSLDELINIYQLKIRLLKELQSEMDKMNNHIRKINRGSKKAPPVFINI